MKPLDDIPTFPPRARKTLESRYGIDSAESFFAHAAHDPEALAEGLGVSRQEVDRLAKIVEGHLSPEYVERCRRPLTHHPRGLIIDRDPKT
jgi:hypothetical protein